MSAEKPSISPEAVMQELLVLRDTIEKLQSILEENTALKNDYMMAREAIEKIAETKSYEILSPLNTRRTVLAMAELKDKDKFIIHIGGDIFAELSRGDAVKLLLKFEGEIARDIDRISSDLQRLASRYAQLQALLAELQRQSHQEKK